MRTHVTDAAAGRRRQALGAVLALAALGAGVERAAADFIVLASSSSGYERGDLLRNADALAVEEGARLRLMTPAGDTREIFGPKDGLVGELEGALDPMDDGFQRLVAYLGGDGRDRSRTLATRSADAFFFVSGAPVGPEGGAYCYASASSVRLERRDASGDAQATVSSPAGARTVDFADGERAAPWPVPVRSGQDYAVDVTPGGSATVTLLRLSAPSSGDPDLKLALLAEKGCFTQVELLLAQ